MSFLSAVRTFDGAPPDPLVQQLAIEQRRLISESVSVSSQAWGDHMAGLHLHLHSSLPEDKINVQPLWAPDLSCALVADLRLDNRDDLLLMLGLPAHEPRSDAEILLEAWRRWGEDCLDHLVGGFAFVVWNARTKTIFAARDATGERTLFFVHNQRFIALASLVTSLLALPGCNQGTDEEVAAHWLVFLSPGFDRTFFRGIRKIPPGHFLRVTPDSLSLKRYWHPYMGKPVRFKSDAEYEEGLRDVLRVATEARLRTSGSVACLVSSGLDSSAIAATAAPLLAAQGKQLTAITAVPRPNFDPAHAKQVWSDERAGPLELARMYPNIENVLVDTSGRSLVSAMVRWGLTAGVPTFNLVNFLWGEQATELCQQRGIPVLLSGATGNATISFSNFSILNQLFRSGHWRELFRVVSELRHQQRIGLRRGLGYALGSSVPQSVSHWLFQFSESLSLPFSPIHPKLLKDYGNFTDELTSRNSSTRQLEEMRMDFYADRDLGPINAAQLAFYGVEARDPTEDRRVYEYSYNIPPEQWLKHGHTRSLIRRAMKNVLPDSIRLEYRIGCQDNDWHVIMNEQLSELRAEFERIEGSSAAARVIDLDRLRQLLQTWPAVATGDDSLDDDYHLSLSRGLSLGAFMRQFPATAAQEC